MKKVKIVLSTVLVIVILSMCVLPTLAEEYDNQQKSVESKLSKELVKVLSDNTGDDNVPIIIFLKSCDKTPVFSELQDKYGYDTNAYEDYNRYNKEIVPNVMVGDKTVKELLMGNEFSRNLVSLDNEDSVIDYSTRKSINSALVKNANDYLDHYRKELSKAISCYVDEFVKENESLLDNIVSLSDCVECIIADVSPENIKKLTYNSAVKKIYYYVEAECVEDSWNSNSLAATDSVTGVGSSNYNNGIGYDGEGTKICVLEFNGRYDSDNYNLSDADLTYISVNSTADNTNSSHATNVTSLVCGKKVTVDGKVYEGAAKGATVYQISVNKYCEFKNALTWCKNNGVDVVNFSGGFIISPDDANNEYSYIDQYVDQFIKNHKISFVKSSGNNHSYITAPGKAYNAITVGNLKTKSSTNVPLSAPYSINSSSCYIDNSFLADKPDIVAPGTNIFLPISDTEVMNVGSGTSYAAPIVTALVAQLMQYDEFAYYNPNCAKNYIVCGASNNDITGTTVSYGQLTDESGAGLVNAVNTYNVVDSQNNYYGAYLYTYNAPGAFSTKAVVNLHRRKHFRAVVTFMNEGDDDDLSDGYGNNIDIRLVRDNPYSTYCVYSTSLYNNVEVIDTYIDTTMDYSLQIRLTGSILNSGDNPDLHYWISWREY